MATYPDVGDVMTETLKGTANETGFEMAMASPLLGHFVAAYDGQHPLLDAEPTDMGCAYGRNVYSALKLLPKSEEDARVKEYHKVVFHNLVIFLRWWAVLHHPSISVQSIPQVPKMIFEPTVIHLIPAMLKMPEDQLRQLILTIHELAMFKSQPRGLAGRFHFAACNFADLSDERSGAVTSASFGSSEAIDSPDRACNNRHYEHPCCQFGPFPCEFSCHASSQPRGVPLPNLIHYNNHPPAKDVQHLQSPPLCAPLDEPKQLACRKDRRLTQLDLSAAPKGPSEPESTASTTAMTHAAFQAPSHVNFHAMPPLSREECPFRTLSIATVFTPDQRMLPMQEPPMSKAADTPKPLDSSNILRECAPTLMSPASTPEQKAISSTNDETPATMAPSHVPLHAMPPLSREECPTQTSFIATTDHETDLRKVKNAALSGSFRTKQHPASDEVLSLCSDKPDFTDTVTGQAKASSAQLARDTDRSDDHCKRTPSHVNFQAMLTLNREKSPSQPDVHDPRLFMSRSGLTLPFANTSCNGACATEPMRLTMQPDDSAHTPVTNPGANRLPLQAPSGPAPTSARVELLCHDHSRAAHAAMAALSFDSSSKLCSLSGDHMLSPRSRAGDISPTVPFEIELPSLDQFPAAASYPAMSPFCESATSTTPLSARAHEKDHPAEPSHVSFHAMPPPDLEEGPAPTSFIATTVGERAPKRSKTHHDTAGPTYHASGGLNSFASHPPAAEDSVTDSTPAHTDQLAAPSPTHREVTPDSKTFPVRVGLFGQVPHEVQVEEHSTVAQLLEAESRLLGTPQQWRAVNIIGTPLDNAKLLRKYDIVFMFPHDAAIPPFDFQANSRPIGCPDAQERLSILWTQQGWVATDEMAFYLRQLHAWGLSTTDPIIAHTHEDLNTSIEAWLIAAMETAYQSDRPSVVRTAFLFDNHWMPLKVRVTRELMDVFTTPEGFEVVSTLPDLISFDDAVWNLIEVDTLFPYDCGFQTFAWLHEVDTGGVVIPMSTARAEARRCEFEQFCLSEYSRQPFQFGGTADDKLSLQLQQLLESHGVAQDRSESCASHLLAVLGRQSIANTLMAPKPWRDLKTKANSQQPPIQIVLSAELHQAVAKRAQEHNPVGRKSAKKPQPVPKKPLVLPADKVAIPSGIFQQQDGVKLDQLSIRQISNDAKGVVVANVTEALPFFQLNEPMSTQGIGLLILDHQDPRIPESKVLVQFPAHFSETDEPILVTAALLQLGAQRVQRHKPDTCVKIEEIETRVVRLLAYRDQLKLDWASLLQGPVKALLALDPLTSIPQDHILDIWDRQYMDSQFRKTPPKDAFMFACTLRLHSSSAKSLLDMSGNDGLFTEPRSDNGRRPAPDFRVVWLPKRSHAEALFINQTTTQPSWLVRNGDRYGLRVSEADASEVHRLHRPEISFLEGTTVMTYKVGPLPWGTTKASLQKVFHQWQWPARPGQPQGQAADGVFWSAQASAHPSHWVFTMMHGDVLISHNDALKDAKNHQESTVIASARTLRQMTSKPSRTFDKTGTDPWLMSDPWQTPSKPAPPVVTPAQLATMQPNIEQNLRQAIQVPEDASMTEAHESRVAALEDQVKQLTTNVSQLTGPCEDKPGLVIGSLNPTGLMHKSALLSDLPSGNQAIWGVSESHLTQMGITKFKGELSFNRSPFAYHPGAPVPYRSRALSSIGGKQIGTGFLATLPCRPISNSWPTEVWESCRLSSHTFRYCDQWIHGAVFYGPAQAAETLATRQEADELLSYLTQQIVMGLPGKRFIVGDFNQHHGLLQQTAIWAAQGWREIQDMEQQRTGKLPVMTCKASTRKDFVWISPELQPFWQSTSVDNMLFKDHAVLSASFAPFGKPEKIPLWRKPKPIPWEKFKQPMPAGSFSFHDGPPHAFCTRLAAEFERRANQLSLAETGHALLSCQKGRSQTSEVVLVPESQGLLRPSRPGSASPEFHGTHVMHKRWFKQLRRLEAYARNACKPAQSMQKALHLTREWRAILNAPGFTGGFKVWWACRDTHMPEVPYDLPDSPLEAHAATALCFAFEVEVRALEKVLIKEMVNKAKQHHVDNPMKIFKDVQKPQVQPVQMLIDRSSATVLEVDADENAFTFDERTQFDVTQNLSTSKGPLVPIHASEDKVWVEDLSTLAPGDQVTQDTPIGDLATLFARFGQEWSARWDKHRHQPESIWDPVLDFVDQSIPQGPSMQYEPITAEQILSSLKKKKRTAATGPDGWSRADLLALAPDLVQSIADMFTWVEAGNPWPVSLTTGIIHALEKLAQAHKVSHYRPITVFSLIYRTWSSLRSSQILSFLADKVPSKCFGNVPRKTAKDVWFGIQLAVEDHYFSGRPLTGCMLDLIKAFNHLPRLPIIKVGIAMGLPTQILKAWSTFLCTMERRFFIRGATGPPLQSCSGLPEGCGMSVVGMLLTNVIANRWLEVRVPRCTMWSYVDNLELLSSTASEVQRGYQELEHVLSMLDVPIDANKTIFWSTAATERQELRSTECPVVFWTRDLGGHVQYSRQMTNSVITSKLEQFKPRWKALAHSKAAYTRKLHAIRAVALPNVLHGIASAFLGNAHFDDLRTNALRAIGEHRPGASPILHFSLLSHPLVDPGFYAIWQTLLETRKYVAPDSAFALLTEASRSVQTFPKPGPCHVLLRRMHQLLWHWNQHDSFVDEYGDRIDIWNSPIQCLLVRVTEAWQSQVAGQISCRKTFTGMQHCHATLSTRKSPTDSVERGLLRTVMNGTFYTADHLPHRDASLTDQCPFCGQPDSASHRNWECQALEAARRDCPVATRQAIQQSAPSLFNHGWVARPASLLQFRQSLDKLASEVQFQIPADPHQEVLDLFTDGSCLGPRDPLSRLASWGVVQGVPSVDMDFAPVAAGLLPGRFQTVTRAEMFAAVIACRYANMRQKPFRLWIDNQHVVKCLRHFARQATFLSQPQRPNHDLLQQLWEAFNAARPLFLGVYKVMSHQHVTSEQTPAEAWIIRGNHAADALAMYEFSNHTALLSLRSTLLTEISSAESQRDWAHHVFIQVGKLAMTLASQQATRDPGEEPRFDAPLGPVEMIPWTLPVRLPEEVRQYEIADWPFLAEWIQSLHASSGNVRYWSWFQLYADFCMMFPGKSPWFNTKKLQWESGDTLPDVPFVRRARWFTSFLTNLAKRMETVLPVKYRSPDSFVIHYWVNCLPVKVIACDCAQEHLDAVDALQMSEIRTVFGMLPSDLKEVQGIAAEVGGFSGILVSEVLHFLTGDAIEESIKNFKDLLAPGGRLCITMFSPNANISGRDCPVGAHWRKIFNQRQESGYKWPGEES
eukprot:s49_g75.t1